MAVVSQELKRGCFLGKANGTGGLLVIFSGMRDQRFAADGQLVRWLHEELPHCDILHFSLGRKAFLSFEKPEQIAADFVEDMDAVCDSGQYGEIRFLAHSTGAAMARKVLIGGAGPEICGQLFEEGFRPTDKQRNWVGKVTRLVSVAGYARGWIANPRNSLLERLAMNVVGLVGHMTRLMPWTRVTEPLMFAFRRGSRFVFNTRMQWLGLMNSKHAGGSAMPQVIHVLPANDSLISSMEVIDVEISDQHRSVHYLQVPQSSHSDVLDVGVSTSTNHAEQKRKTMLRHAIGGQLFGDLAGSAFECKDALPPSSPGISVPVEHLDDVTPARPDPSVTDFVFVIHGIRDTGSWAKKIGIELRRQAAVIPGRIVKTDTQSYGYFTAFPFLFPWIRKQKVEWLMDRYATSKALYPNARMSFVGHSNGTYLAASALKEYTCCSFVHVVFAGSVVRHDFEWGDLLQQSQRRVERVLNYVATRDTVLALLSDGVRKLVRFLDLGGAGHNGFVDRKGVHNIRYVVGGHGAGIAEHTWLPTASFVLHGTNPPSPTKANAFFDVKQSRVAVALNVVSPVLLLFSVFLALYVSWNFVHHILDLPAATLIGGGLDLAGKLEGFESWQVRLASLAETERAFWHSYANISSWKQAVVSFVWYWLLWFGLFRA